jgi:hypothetical protein
MVFVGQNSWKSPDVSFVPPLPNRARSSLVSNEGIMSFFATSVKLETKDRKSKKNISTASDLTEFRYGHILFSVDAAGHRRVVILLTVGEN